MLLLLPAPPPVAAAFLQNALTPSDRAGHARILPYRLPGELDPPRQPPPPPGRAPGLSRGSSPAVYMDDSNAVLTAIR
jgi:hypothetical protein